MSGPSLCWRLTELNVAPLGKISPWGETRPQKHVFGAQEFEMSVFARTVQKAAMNVGPDGGNRLEHTQSDQNRVWHVSCITNEHAVILERYFAVLRDFL